MIRFWLAFALIALPAKGVAAAEWWQTGPALPALTGRVVDEAALLSPPQEAALTRTLAAYEARTRHQFVVVTVKSLHGQTIERFGIRLGRTWGIGRRAVDDGVLLIVAPNERKVRVEVGYGLERQISDPESARIIRDVIVPAFGKGDMAGGIARGADAIMALPERPAPPRR